MREAGNRVVVFDGNTARLFGEGVPDPVLLEDRDEAKTWRAVERVLLGGAGRRGMDRGGEVLAVGGGAVCDVAGFAASIYLRGVRLTLVPTTVTAMVDAALGGKTGINLRQGKNLVGTFYPAHSLVVVPRVVSRLPRRRLPRRARRGDQDGAAGRCRAVAPPGAAARGGAGARAGTGAGVREPLHRGQGPLRRPRPARGARRRGGARTEPRGPSSTWATPSPTPWSRHPASPGRTGPRWRGAWCAQCAWGSDSA